MTGRLLSRLREELAGLDAAQALRRRRTLQSAQGVHIRLDGREWLSFCSNDYLGLAAHPALAGALAQAAFEQGAGAGASHLLSGHHALHAGFEAAFAGFTGLPRALLFSTGYMANLALVTAFVGRDGAVFADRLNHASLNDAAVLSRARLRRWPHGDLAALERLLAQETARERLVAVDGVFSMDGDLSDLPRLVELCERFDAWLVVDDAHGFGVLGEHGRGILSHFGLQSPNILYLATLGKAAGVAGAAVAGQPEAVEWLVQKARTYIYTTAQPPALAAALSESLRQIAMADEARARLTRLTAQLRSGLAAQGWRLADSATPIQPVILGENETALAASAALEGCGVLVPAIRPPTVAPHSARLRISLSAAHSEEDIDRLLAALDGVAR